MTFFSGKDTFNKNVKAVRIAVDIANKQPKDASVAVVNGELVVTYNLQDALTVVTVNDWREVKPIDFDQYLYYFIRELWMH